MPEPVTRGRPRRRPALVAHQLVGEAHVAENARHHDHPKARSKRPWSFGRMSRARSRSPAARSGRGRSGCRRRRGSNGEAALVVMRLRPVFEHRPVPGAAEGDHPGRRGAAASEAVAKEEGEAPVTAFTAPSRRAAGGSPRSGRGEGFRWRARKRWKWGAVPGCMVEEAWRLSRTAACSTTAAARRRWPGPPGGRAAPSWSSEVVNASSKGPTRSQASRRTARFRAPQRAAGVASPAGRAAARGRGEVSASASGCRDGEVNGPPATGADRGGGQGVDPAGRAAVGIDEEEAVRRASHRPVARRAGFRRSRSRRNGPAAPRHPSRASRPRPRLDPLAGRPCPARPASVRSIQGESRSGMRR